MEKTTVVIAHAFGNAELYVPGFLSITEMRPIDEWGRTEFYVLYDDEMLGQVSLVAIGASSAPGPVNSIPLGIARAVGGVWAYISYTATPAPNYNANRTMTVQGRGYENVFYFRGFVAVDHVRAGEQDEYDLVVRTEVSDPTITKLTVTFGGPQLELPPDSVGLGVVYVFKMPRYVRYLAEVVTP